MLHRICSLRKCRPSCLHVSTGPNSYVRFDWSVILGSELQRMCWLHNWQTWWWWNMTKEVITASENVHNILIVSSSSCLPITQSTHVNMIDDITGDWSIALKLQIGKDDDKKESKYQKYIYYASNGFMANQVKTPIQNYFEKVLYENLTFEIPPLCFFKSSRGIKQIVTSPCGSLFVLSSFFFWPLFCLSFDLRLLLIPFVSPYSSYT